MKKCAKCKISKKHTEFYRSSRAKDGLQSYCILCNKEHNLQNPVSSTVLLRLKAIEILGGACVECGFSDPRALQIDHVDGGGHQERQSIGNRETYKRVINGEKGYQVLCANHNWIKKAEQKEHGKRFSRSKMV